jgi:hypothetical protein
MCVPTWIPAPRSPSLGKGSLSIIRTGIPFFRSDRARTRPEGPAPTYNNFHADQVIPILLQSLQSEQAACVCLMQGCEGAVKVDVDEKGHRCLSFGRSIPAFLNRS